MKTKFYDISILRVIAMLLVVYYHCICTYGMWGAAFDSGDRFLIYDKLLPLLSQTHLPIFFIIAGYLFGYKRLRGGYGDTRQFLKDKATRVLVPYVTVGIFIVAIKECRGGTLLVGTISHLWFLITIFECYAIGKLIDFVMYENARNRLLIFLFACFSMVIWCRYGTILGSIFTLYFSFYLIGMLMSTINIERITTKQKLLLCASFLFLCLMIAEVWIEYRATLLRSVSIWFVFTLFLWFRTLKINDIPNWLKSLDTCSMGIYIVHHIIIRQLCRTDIGRTMFHIHYYAFPIILFVVVLLVSWAIVYQLKKYKFSKYFIG